MNGKAEMSKGNELHQGKTKIIYELPQRPGHVLIVSKDNITAGDGAKSDNMEGKAVISNQTACSIFQFLNEVGIKNHFVEKYDEKSFIARRCYMIPIEFVTRRLATGSFLKRNPGVPEKYKFNPPLLETFYKDDENHDPQWSNEQIVSAAFEYKVQGSKDESIKLTTDKLEALLEQTRAIFEILERAWKTRNCTLVDMKIEFGVDYETGEIILADIIDSDSWRLWPQGDRSQMKDKQVYREMDKVTQEGLQAVKANFKWIADELKTIFEHKINAEAAIFMGSPSDQEHCEKIKQEISKFGISSTLVVASAHKSTEYTLRRAAEFEGKDAPVVFVAVAGRSNGLGPVLSGNVLAPVINCPPPTPELSEDVWSSLRVPTGLGCTTVLYPGACAFAVAGIIALSDFKVWAYFKARQTNQKTSIILANKQ